VYTTKTTQQLVYINQRPLK
jgi:hypothetical protein